VTDLAPKEAYTREEVLRLLSISQRQLRSWERHDLVRPLESFAFSDLIALRTLIKLRESRVPAEKIRLALSALRKKMRHVADPLKELKVFSDGRRIHVEIAGAPIGQAIEAYEKAAELDPNSAGALVNLGTIHFNARDLAKAENCYKAAIAIDGDYALAHFNIANLYDEQGDYEKATSHYTVAVNLNPQYADAHYNLALLHQGNGRVMEAVRHWKLYLKLDPASEWGAIARRELNKLRLSTVLDGKNLSDSGSSSSRPHR
jgi:tetratricopeptide (TPR) repeat protein